MDLSADLDAMFDTSALAKAATLQGGAAGAVPVFFDQAYLEQLGVAGTSPAALAKASDVAEADIGKTLTIDSVVWTIQGREPQDDGATVLLRLKS